MKGREREWLLFDCASTSCPKKSLQWPKELRKKKIQQKGGGDANFEAMAGGDSGINTGHLLHLHRSRLTPNQRESKATYLRFVGIIGFLFCMFFNFYPSDLHNETCVALANLRWSIINKNWIECQTFLWFSYGYLKCTFGESLTEYTGPPNCVHHWVWIVDKIWSRSSISFKNMCLYAVCSFDPNPTTYQSTIGVQLRKLSNTCKLYTNVSLWESLRFWWCWVASSGFADMAMQ